MHLVGELVLLLRAAEVLLHMFCISSAVATNVGEGLQTDEGGVRHSKRQKVAPLEYWRNEKKEYTRDHRSKLNRCLSESMPTA